MDTFFRFLPLLSIVVSAAITYGIMKQTLKDYDKQLDDHEKRIRKTEENRIADAERWVRIEAKLETILLNQGDTKNGLRYTSELLQELWSQHVSGKLKP